MPLTLLCFSKHSKKHWIVSYHGWASLCTAYFHVRCFLCYNESDMESVVFDGKEYTKASVLAERFRYTQDYLGQLCRGKKVDARLVGRAWYINLDSLQSHRSARYKAQKEIKAAEISHIKPSNNYLSRIDIEPVLKGKTVRIVKNDNDEQSEVSVKYEADDYSLIPKVQKATPATWIPICPAEAEVLSVKEELPGTKFKPEPLPEVYLSGQIAVEGIPEMMEEAKVGSDSEHIEENEVKKPDIAIKTKTEQGIDVQESKFVSVKKIPKRRFPERTMTKIVPTTSVLSTAPAPKKVSPQAPFRVENYVHETRSMSAIDVPSLVGIEQTTSRVLPTLIAAFFVAMVSSLFILSLATEVVVLDGRYSDRILIDSENLVALTQRTLSQ